jgi:uncharacterized FlgJ-related protein
MQATITKMEWVKDQNGNHVYTPALEKFRLKMIKQMERQNKKIEAGQKVGRLMSYSVCDPIEYAESMVKMYGHQFREMTPGNSSTIK